MGSLIFRFGQLESRLASQSLWTGGAGKRKRGAWVCGECRRRDATRQRRSYSDDGVIGTGNYLNNPFPSRQQADDSADAPRTFSWRNGGFWEAGKAKHRWKPSAWGLEESTADATPQAETEASAQASLGSAQRDDVTEKQQSELWEQLERTENADASDEDYSAPVRNVDAQASYRAHRDSVLDIDYATELSKAISSQSPEWVAQCLFDAERKDDLAFIRAISPGEFSACLDLLQPHRMTKDLATAHYELSEAITKVLGLSPMRQVAWQHASLLQQLVAIRRSANLRSNLDDVRMLLRAARDLGHKAMAVRVWRHMLEDGLLPDTSCYNYYMAALVFNDVHDARGRHNIRVIPFHKLARQTQRLGAGYAGYRMGEGGLRMKLLNIFGNMLKAGAFANEKSFRIVMMATAREGDLATVESILKKVWGVDVAALRDGSMDETSLPPVELDRSSPLYPSSDLLFAIAHALCINNDVPTALRTVDFVARRYDMDIPESVWQQLHEWTFVLACPRTDAKSRTNGERDGMLPKQSVVSLWQTMTGPPYNIEPSLGMYNRLLKNLWHRQMPYDALEKMIEARRKIDQDAIERGELWREIEHCVKSQEDQLEVESVSLSPEQDNGAALRSLRQSWEMSSVIKKRNLFWLQRWCRLLLAATPRRMAVDVSGNFSLRVVPSVLWDWRLIASKDVSYEVPGGLVEFSLHDETELDANRKSRRAKFEDREKVLARLPPTLTGSRIWLER